MAVLESGCRADQYGFQTANYLTDWARRTGNLASIANYYVEDRIDGSTGLIWYYLRPVTDLAADPSADSSDSTVIDLSSPIDTTVAAEDASQQ